jgi:butyryl-CoA dehydrogenase
MRGGAALGLLAQRMTATIDRGQRAGGDAADYATVLAAALERLLEVTGTLWGTGDPELALANASVYLEAAGHIVIAWLWLEQMLAAAGKEGDFYDGKRQAARYFYTHELPRTRPQLDLLATLDRTTLDMRDAWF